MNIKVKVADQGSFGKKVYLTLKSGEMNVFGRLKAFLIAEGFISNPVDGILLETNKSGQNETYVYKVRTIPEKWAGQKVVSEEPQLVTSTPPAPKKRKTKNKKDNTPLNSEDMEKKSHLE